MIIKYKFSVETRYVGSRVEEIVEIEIDENSTDEEIEFEVDQYFEAWIYENIEGATERIESEND
jgi:hypothetical protein